MRAKGASWAGTRLCHYYIYFSGVSISKPKLLQYILVTQTDHSSSVPPKYHSLIASYTIEAYMTDQSYLD